MKTAHRAVHIPATSDELTLDRGHSYRQHMTKTAKRLAILLIVVVAGVGCRKSTATTATAANISTARDGMSESDRREKLAEDLELVRRYDEGLQNTIAYARARPDLFIKSEDIQLTPAQKGELREIWQTVLDYMRALDRVKADWKDFHKYGMIRKRRAHIESFMAGYIAWITQYRHGLEFIELTVPSDAMEKLLDERSRSHEIPEGSFAGLKWNVINVAAVSRLAGSHQYWKTLRGSLQDYDCGKKPECDWSRKTIEDYHEASKEKLKARGVTDFTYNAFDIARDMSFDAWFPVQAGVAEWMGDTKVARLHQHLVSKQQLNEMRQAMQPGDVIVARHNWYLSNIGLPGFWPHAELYVGSPEELTDYFADPEVKQYFKEKYDVADFPTYLQKTYPKAYTRFLEPEEGKPRRVVEAISEGVVMRSLELAAGADYVAVMRPTQSKLDKALAIARAFELWGLPYDFNFDFTTDDSLVCTELVYKSWRASQSKGGLGIETSKVMGRVTLPANDIVRQYDELADEEAPPLDFVYFLDGREKDRNAVVATEADFRASWKRPKWDIVQE